jgi:hypothetical protein
MKKQQKKYSWVYWNCSIDVFKKGQKCFGKRNTLPGLRYTRFFRNKYGNIPF